MSSSPVSSTTTTPTTPNRQKTQQQRCPMSSHCHVFVLQHGLHGTDEDFYFVEQSILSKEPTTLMMTTEEESDNNNNNNNNDTAAPANQDDSNITPTSENSADRLVYTIRVRATNGRTHDGIEILGQLNALEVVDYCVNKHKLHEKFERIYLSFIGHSLGGLINRNAITWLFHEQKKNCLYDDSNSGAIEIFSRFAPVRSKCVPTSFLTLTSPHLGSRRPGGSFMRALWRFGAHSFLSTVVGRTGQELSLTDEIPMLMTILEANNNNNSGSNSNNSSDCDSATSASNITYIGGGNAHHSSNSSSNSSSGSGKRSSRRKSKRTMSTTQHQNMCLLDIMSHPNSVYMKALEQFRFRTALAISHFDMSVPFSSASVRSFNPYPVPKYTSVPEFKIVGYSGFEDEKYLSGLLHPRMRNVVVAAAEANEETKQTEPEPQKEAEIEPVQPTSQVLSTSSVEVAQELAQQVIRHLSVGELKGTEHEPHDGDDNSNGYFSDNVRDVEFAKHILHNLQSVRWRRVDVEFTLQRALQQHMVHIMPVRKSRSYRTAGADLLDKAAAECVDFVAQLLWVDHDTLLQDASQVN